MNSPFLASLLLINTIMNLPKNKDIFDDYFT